MNEKINVYTDCTHFPLDRPCLKQKNFSMQCANCPDYQKISSHLSKTKILIIKIGAMGDVLRTTFLLEGLKELYPASDISWIVSPKNSAVLENNPYIDNIVFCDDKTNIFLVSNFFDITINLDLSPESLAFTKLASTAKILGFSIDNCRNITVSNSYAAHWLNMSASDKLKKENTNTYQYWMSKIAQLPSDKYEIVVPLRSEMQKKAASFLKDNNIKHYKKIIGINPGAGKRWQLKKWNIHKFIETAKYFSDKGHAILLLGGKDDKEEIEIIMKEKINNVFSTGTENDIDYFFALIDLCDIVLCGDTMALHAATGLKKKTVVLFGPTSHSEIELYGRGIKVIPEMDCLSCYNQTCAKNKTCMDSISTQQVIDIIESMF
jgi:heptosyltransferase-2